MAHYNPYYYLHSHHKMKEFSYPYFPTRYNKFLSNFLHVVSTKQSLAEFKLIDNRTLKCLLFCEPQIPTSLSIYRTVQCVILLVHDIINNRLFKYNYYIKHSSNNISCWLIRVHEDSCLLGFCAMQWRRNCPTFQTCLLPSSSGR